LIPNYTLPNFTLNDEEMDVFVQCKAAKNLDISTFIISQKFFLPSSYFDLKRRGYEIFHYENSSSVLTRITFPIFSMFHRLYPAATHTKKNISPEAYYIAAFSNYYILEKLLCLFKACYSQG
jgi:hypothetical protein